ncbi:MAG: flagellar biosynthesis protein FlgM [Oscillospiraceae bacterium]|nr:flagellar biosynthesis protein FlgM [Oscillospiraceae bacterium]
MAQLGAIVSYLSESTVEIDCTHVHDQDPPYDLMRKIRASYYLIPADEITVTLCRDTAPAELFHYLENRNIPVVQQFPGVYYLEGAGLFPTQVVVTSELRSSGHLFLKILSKNAREEDVRAFILSANKLTSQGDLARVDAVLQVSASANPEMYRRIYKEGPEMCQALREIMKEDFVEAEARGEAKGTIIGAVGTLRDLGFTNDEILSRIIKKYNLTQAEAESYVLVSA